MKRVVLAKLIVATFACGAAHAGNVSVTLVSHSFTGVNPDGSVMDAAVSADGNTVVFSDNATNLVNPPLPSGPGRQIYAWNRLTGAIELISHDVSGNPGNGQSDLPRVSGDGRYVVFNSFATNLVPGDTNGWKDVFYYDRTLGIMRVVSATGSGTFGNANSQGGQDISRDGQTVAFASDASNLVATDSNGTADIFVRRMNYRYSVGIASVTSGGNQVPIWSDNPIISGDGNSVAFRCGGNLAPALPSLYSHAFLHNAWGTALLSVSDSGAAAGDTGAGIGYAVNNDGSLVAFPSSSTNLVVGDTNAFSDAFVRDVTATTTYLASLTGGGAQGNNHTPQSVGMSDDGRYVAFGTFATNFLSPDANGVTEDIFVRDRVLNTTDLVSQTPAGVQANQSSFKATMNASGQFIVFISQAGNLTSGTSGGNNQVYIAQRW